MERLRNQIDKIDDNLVDLLEKRKSIVKKIWQIKKQQKLPLIDLKREREIINKAKKRAKTLNKKELEKLFKEVILISRK